MNSGIPQNFRKYVTVVLLITMNSMTISCSVMYSDKREIEIARVSFESKYCEGSYVIDRSMNAYLKEGGHVFYDMEMKVVQDTIISAGLKFNDTGTDSVYISNLPLSVVHRFEYADALNEHGKIFVYLMIGVVAVYLVNLIFTDPIKGIFQGPT